jgi:hypothetical protein
VFRFKAFAIVLSLALCGSRAQAQDSGAAATAPSTSAEPSAPAQPSSAALDTVPAGTKITIQNWTQYRQFMPDGMVALFQGTYYWKMPADVEMEVGPTIIHPLPRTYLEATEKYASQVKLVELPDGGLTLEGYHGGIPFPSPTDPHKGWKILANEWYRYQPHLAVDTHGSGCLLDRRGSINCVAAELLDRQLAYNTDPGVPASTPGAEGKFYAQYLMVLEPEQRRYTASLTVSYADPARPEDVYAFIPQLRRYQPVSALARCSPNQGTDATQEDNRQGFDSSITEFSVGYVGAKKILWLVGLKLPTGKFPDDYDMPLGWPKPSWGKWQLRDVYVISLSKIPSRAAGYCYGRRVMYVDKATFAPLWEELYDSNLRPWKFLGLFLETVDVPGIGLQDGSAAQVEAFWDVQNDHATFFTDPAENRPFYVNEQAPKEYLDLTRYTDPSGLNLIMR